MEVNFKQMRCIILKVIVCIVINSIIVGCHFFNERSIIYNPVLPGDYPNPVNDVLTISSSNGISCINIFNIYGQKIYIKRMDIVNNEIEIDASSLNSGVYVVNITTPYGKTISKKFIKK